MNDEFKQILNDAEATLYYNLPVYGEPEWNEFHWALYITITILIVFMIIGAFLYV